MWPKDDIAKDGSSIDHVELLPLCCRKLKTHVPDGDQNRSWNGSLNEQTSRASSKWTLRWKPKLGFHISSATTSGYLKLLPRNLIMFLTTSRIDTFDAALQPHTLYDQTRRSKQQSKEGNVQNFPEQSADGLIGQYQPCTPSPLSRLDPFAGHFVVLGYRNASLNHSYMKPFGPSFLSGLLLSTKQ